MMQLFNIRTSIKGLTDDKVLERYNQTWYHDLFDHRRLGDQMTGAAFVIFLDGVGEVERSWSGGGQN